MDRDAVEFSCQTKGERRMASRFEGYRKYVDVAMVAGALVFLFYMGFWRHRTSDFMDHDSKFWYVAGKCWLHGVSPYNHAAYLDVWHESLGPPTWGWGRSFVYPPTMAIVAVPMALLPWSIAHHLYRLALLAAFGSICVFVVKLLREPDVAKKTSGDLWFYLALCAVLYPVSVNLAQGQSSPLVIWGMVAAFYGWHRRMTHWIIIGVAFACIKPQLSLPLLVYLCCRQGFVPVAIGAAIAGASALLAVLPGMSATFFSEYAGSMAVHTDNRENTWFYYDSLPSILGDTPVAVLAALVGVILACCGALWLAYRQPRFKRLDSGTDALRDLQVLCALTAAMMPLHRYDSAVYLPVVASLVILPSRWQRLILAGAILLHGRTWFVFTGFLMPGSDFWRGAGYASVATALIAGLVVVLLAVFHRQDTRSAEVPDPAPS